MPKANATKFEEALEIVQTQIKKNWAKVKVVKVEKTVHNPDGATFSIYCQEAQPNIEIIVESNGYLEVTFDKNRIRTNVTNLSKSEEMHTLTSSVNRKILNTRIVYGFNEWELFKGDFDLMV